MATLEQLSAALVKADAAGNAADAKVFADAIRQMQAAPATGIPGPRQGVDQFGIPSTIKPAEPEAPRSLFQRAMGNIETIPALAAGAVSGVVTPIAQLGHELTQGKAFTPEGKAAAAQFGQQVQNQFYQPRTPEAQRNVQAIGEAVIPLAGLHLGGPANALAPATRAVTDAARSEGSLVSGAVNNALVARAAKAQEANITQSYQNAPKIEAAQLANEHGIALNPVQSNPTKGNQARAIIAGDPNINAGLSKANEPKWTQLVVEKGLDLPANTRLDATAIQTALDNASKPYDAVRAIPELLPDQATLDTLSSLKKTPSAVSKGKVEATNGLIDNMIEEIKQGRSGADVLNDIRQLRAEANSVYKARDKGLNVPKASEIADADARMGVANAYEKMIDANVKDPQVLADLQAARTKMAQIYDIDRATDFATNKVDPKVFAKMVSEGKPMTGIAGDIGRIAANYPEIAKIGAQNSLEAKLTRGGVAGTLGYGLGTLVGSPIAGSILGGGAGFLAGKAGAKIMATPEYQAARAIPKDYRPNALSPNNQNALAK